ncbi:14292_t:CDS:2 [Dentiscutata erythropus]|uniref:14292_t:CDS:1 n=1 Tax=Dentiscutata erythropus TaxID=1348616 RepID=A0A9N9EL18_9GLOM|nr:14292_t:CDS:2 [Dentiscutata erythropus]
MTSQSSSLNDNVTLQSQTNFLLQCKWELLLITNCEGSSYLVQICYVSIILCLTISVLSLAILVYKTIWNNIQIRMNPLKGFLTSMILYGIIRAVSMLIATNDWIHDSYILKAVVAALGWAFGCNAIAIYLVSIFKVLPRLALNQHTVFSVDADLPEDHLTANRFIPNPNSVLKVYWAFTIASFVCAIILSILKGYFQGTGKELPFSITYTLLAIQLGVSDVLGIVCFIKYGRLIIKLLDESATLMGLMDIKYSHHRASCLKNYSIYLKKPTCYSLLAWVFGFFYSSHEKDNRQEHANIRNSSSYKLRRNPYGNVDHTSWNHLRRDTQTIQRTSGRNYHVN